MYQLLYLEFLKIPVKTDSNKYLDTLQKLSTNTNFDTVIFPIYIYIYKILAQCTSQLPRAQAVDRNFPNNVS